MATITEEYKVGTGTTRTFTTQYINESDIKVRVNGGSPLVFTTGTPTTGQYNIASNATTITFGDSYDGTDVLHIYSETDVSSPTVNFTPGSSIKAADLNSLETLVRHGIKENRNQIIDQDIRPGVVTSSHIKDGTLVDADISGSAAIAHSKIATGTLPSGIQVVSANIVDGTIVNADVSDSANIQGSKLADDSVAMTKLGSGFLPTDITVASANIVNGTIVDEDINASAAITGTKVTPNFGSQVVQTTGNIVVGGTVDGRDVANDGTKLDTIELNAKDDQTAAEIKALYESISDTNEFSNTEKAKLAGIETAATIDQTAAEIKTLLQSDRLNDAEITPGALDNRYYTKDELNAGQLDSNYYNATQLDAGQLDTRYYTETELNGGQLDTRYFTESEITGGAADGRYYTETELDAGELDNRYFTETELTGGALDGRYYTETEAEALFLRQDSSETIASGVTWSSANDKVATTAAIDARIIDLLDDTGGFVPLANETSFPAANPDVNNGNGTVVSVKAVSTNLTPSSGTVTIANGAGTGNTVTITGVTGVIPSGFGMILETTSTLHTYAFHRLQAKATEVNAVATNIAQVVACGNNLTSIENFADLYQISTTAPTDRADGGSLTIGDLWFDSSSNQVMMVYDGSAGDGFSAITPSQATITNINSVSGYVTYTDDLGSITDAVNAGAGNNSINTCGANIASINTVAADLNEATSEIDTVATNIANVNTVGNVIANVNTVASNDSNVTAVAGNASNINTVAGINANVTTVAGISSNVTAVAGNFTNINAVNSNESNINAVAGNATNINAVAADATDIGVVAGQATEIGRLGTADAVADMNILGTTAIVSDLDTLADISSNITTVAGIAANVTTVAGNNSNVTAVAGNNTNITAVANNSSNINSAVSNASNINSAVSNASNINSAVSNASNINTVAGSITDVNRYAQEYIIANSSPGSPSAGDLWYNSSGNTLNYYTGGSWVGIAPGIASLYNDPSPELAAVLECNNNNITEVGTISGDNLQIDFGTL